MKKSLDVMDPPFHIEDGEHFDLTLSNQSENFITTISMADKDNRHDEHPPALATLLLKQFPLEDQGLLLIYGPLPPDAISYPASDVFHLIGSFPVTEGNGVGLLVKVDGLEVKVQYGNVLCTLDSIKLEIRSIV
jgi:hypothetical protein